MNKSCDITYRNLWHNVQPSNRPFLVSHWRLKNNLMWKLVLVSNISRTENDLHNISAFLNFFFSAIWSKNQPMPKKQQFSWFFQILAKIQYNWTSMLYYNHDQQYVRYYRESPFLEFQLVDIFLQWPKSVKFKSLF